MENKAGIFLFDLNRQKFLLVHSSNFKPEKWTVPKGNKNEEETCWECARREFREETGVEILWMTPIIVRDLGFVKYGKDSLKRLRCFLYVVDKCSYEIKLDWENDKYKWVNTSEAKNCIFKSQISFLKKIDNILKNEISK